MKSARKRGRQEQRRLKRNVLQNDLVLRGWVPVKHGTDYGLMHAHEHRLALRKWRAAEGAGNLAYNEQHRYQGGWLGANARCATATRRHVWSFVAVSPGAQHYGVVECSWNELQAQWVRGLRAVVIQKGWL